MSEEIELSKTFEGDSFEKLPAQIKKDLKYLSKEIRKSELKSLSPLIDKLISLKDRCAKAELTKEEDGSFSKDSIQIYKSLKSDLRSFNASIRKEVDICKKPYLDIQKKFVTVKTALGNEQSSMLSDIGIVFKDYLDDLEKKKIAREKAKQEKLQEEIDAAKKESKEKVDEADLITKYNNLKYDVIKSLIDEYEGYAETFDVSNLQIKKEDLTLWPNLMAFFQMCENDYDFASLNDIQQSDIIKTFNSTYTKLVSIIDNAIETKVNNTSKISEAISNVPPPPPQKIENPVDAEKILLSEVKEETNKLFLKVGAFLNEYPNSKPITYTVLEQLRFLKNIESK